jgi:small-conductance mechanosensitive channel
MTMAAKDFIGNFLEGVRLFMNRPFVIGDRIRIGVQAYKVKDMDLRYVELERADGSLTMMTYAQLSEKAVTIFRGYSQDAPKSFRDVPARFWHRLSVLAHGASRPGLMAASAWTVLGAALLTALPFLPMLAAPARNVAAWPAYLQAAAVMLAAHSLDRGLVAFVRRAAEKRGWNPQRTVVVKLLMQSALYVLGGSAALRFCGMTWGGLMKSLGATTIAIGWASSNMISNLIQGFWILLTHPFSIGDVVDVSGVSGTVTDMNLSYVVLENDLPGEGRTHTLVPYSVLKAVPFTVIGRAAATPSVKGLAQ